MVSAESGKQLIDQVAKEPRRLKDNIAVWSEMKEICGKYGALSLGEGAPQWDPPQFLAKDMEAAIAEGHNQYSRTFGHPLLVKKIAEVYGPKMNRTIDPMKEVLVALGAHGCINATIAAYIAKGEHVVCFEPFFP